jgi:mono/diheme cytochrome c family protein
MIKTSSHTTLGILALAGLATALPLAGCRGDRNEKPPRQFFPDMDDQPKWHPQGASEFFADGRTMRKPVTGTVAFGRVPWTSSEDWAANFMQQRTDLLRDDAKVYQGTAADGSYLDTIPVNVNLALIEKGREKFNIYCAACHGYDGLGKGMVGSQWSYPLPNFMDAKYRRGATEEVTDAGGKKSVQLARTGLDGYIFHTVRYGVLGPDGSQKMPGYAHALDEHEAWSVVAYFRVLQASYDGVPLADVPEKERAALEVQRAKTPPAPAAPAATTPATPAPATPAPAGKGGNS